MITEEKLERAEHWLHRYEAGGIFFARLLPVIRHLISIPAGIIRMNFGVFSIMTVAGSAIWCTVLAIFGQQVLGTYAKQHPGLETGPEWGPAFYPGAIALAGAGGAGALRAVFRVFEADGEARGV